MLSDKDSEGFIPGLPRPIPIGPFPPRLSSPDFPATLPLPDAALGVFPYAEKVRPPPIPLEAEVSAGDTGDATMVRA